MLCELITQIALIINWKLILLPPSMFLLTLVAMVVAARIVSAWARKHWSWVSCRPSGHLADQLRIWCVWEDDRRKSFSASQLLLVDTDDLSASHKDSRAECQHPPVARFVLLQCLCLLLSLSLSVFVCLSSFFLLCHQVHDKVSRNYQNNKDL